MIYSSLAPHEYHWQPRRTLMKDPLDSLPGYVLRRASAATLAELNQRLRPLQLRHADVAMLILVAERPGITQSEAGRVLDIQRANMAPFVSRRRSAGNPAAAGGWSLAARATRGCAARHSNRYLRGRAPEAGAAHAAADGIAGADGAVEPQGALMTHVRGPGLPAEVGAWIHAR
jgi:hypothetical protein